jgi:hypothetical protein
MLTLTTPPELTTSRHSRPPKISVSTTRRGTFGLMLDPLFRGSNGLKPLIFFGGFGGAPV